MKTEEKGVPHVRLAVLGKFNVGKSAIAVRYLTRRFIGEYRSETDMIYNRAVVVNGTLMDVEIVEVSDKTGKSMTQASQLAADGVVVAYSIVDRDSYEYAKDVVPLLAKQRMPIALMANKADLTQYRTVEESEGRALAKDAGTPYYEVSVAENSDSLYQAFELIVGQCHALLNNNNNNNNSNNNADNCRNNNNNNNSSRSRKFSVSKMLGMVIGSKSSSPPPASTASPQRGTVVAYQRTELFSVLKQRHRSPATASL